MIRLDHSGQHCIINKLGFIEHWSCNEAIDSSHPVYIIMFKNYSRLNPFCRQLNMDTPIDITHWNKTRLDYNKKIGDFQLSCSIELQPHIVWIISPITPCHNHTWGLTIPSVSSDWESVGQKISTQVSVFSASFQEEYRDQLQLDLPIVSNSNISIFGNPGINSQFFTYVDKCSWMRFSCSNNHRSFSIHIMNETTDILKTYLNTFPAAKPLLENQFHEVASQYKIKIKFGKFPADDVTIATCQYSATPTSTVELNRFRSTLSEAMKKYPKDIFVTLNVEQIFMVSKMHS